LKNKEDLIYDLIFSEDTDYKINITDYISDLYKYDKFIDETKIILKKSKVNINTERIIVDSNSVTWEIKVTK
jgi:hypothetical protein